MKTTMLRSARPIGVILLLIASLASCKKETKKEAAQPDLPTIAVEFSNVGVPISDIDSVVAIVRDANLDIKTWKTFTRTNTGFTLSLTGYTGGQYTAQVMAFSKKRADQTARQYEISRTINLPYNHQTVIQSPRGTFTDTWYQRAVFFLGNNDAKVIVAMDPRDSHYEGIFKNASWTRIYLQRYSVDHSLLVASRNSTRNINGLIGFSDRGDYLPYLQIMSGKTWTRGYINGQVEDVQSGVNLDFVYEYNFN